MIVESQEELKNVPIGSVSVATFYLDEDDSSIEAFQKTGDDEWVVIQHAYSAKGGARIDGDIVFSKFLSYPREVFLPFPYEISKADPEFRTGAHVRVEFVDGTAAEGILDTDNTTPSLVLANRVYRLWLENDPYLAIDRYVLLATTNDEDYDLVRKVAQATNIQISEARKIVQALRKERIL